MDPATPLAALEFIPPPRARLLARFGLHTVGDLLEHYPRRHEDRRQFDRFPTQESTTPVCVCGVVVRTVLKRLPGRKKLFEAVLEEEPGGLLAEPLVCRWFNLHFVQQMIATGQRLVVYGKPRLRGGRICLEHPEFEILEHDDVASVHVRRIVPVYRTTGGLSQRVLRQTVFEVLQRLRDNAIPDRLPPALSAAPRADALRQIHFPDSHQQLAAAKRQLALEEFFIMQLFLAARRAETVAQPGAAHCGPGVWMRRLHERLPFPLTGAQQRAIAEIRADLAAPHPMNRLLHGDVGSGKTVVALSAMLLAAEAGFQAALMAPTQILAEQHYLNFKRWLAPLGVEVALRTATRREADATPIVVGTHALLYDGGFDFHRLGLVVIDEQHKFGVLQRARLIARGTLPDVLVMTATPIPRTFTMTLYGDLDVSTLDEMPPGRGRVTTVVRDRAKLPDAAAFLRDKLAAGSQAFIVYPLIEESPNLEAKAATAEFEKWRTLLAPMPCALLHGRLPAEEKEAVMEGFRQGTTRALIATTVIEVGIDVPNATVLLVENAGRFGLAQLHQLRGRIGRGSGRAWCILLDDLGTNGVAEKLGILAATSDGFKIAEADLRLRGPGDLLGTAQSGLPPLKIGDPLADLELMQSARRAAFLLFEHDPRLERPENQCFRALLADTKKRVLSHVS